jgi:hypothetical protein
MRFARALMGGSLVLVVLLSGCRSREDRQERAMEFYQRALSTALLRYDEAKERALSTVSGVEGASERVQQEILELERRIEETKRAIRRIQEGASKMSEGVQRLGGAVGGEGTGGSDGTEETEEIKGAEG